MSKGRFRLPPHKPVHVVSTLSQTMGWSVRQTKIPDTWTVTQGEGQTAMVIDTGLPDHRDIGDNAIAGKNYVTGETIADSQGHSTHCIGIICAKNNSEGMVGVAPKAKCIAVKTLGSDGSGTFEWVYNALRYAIRTRPSVVSMSLGSPQSTAHIHNAIKELYEMNIPVICAAGNSGGRGVDYPAKYSETIAVAAYDSRGRIANFSAIGEEVDWAAPGVAIYSTYLNGDYCQMDGTSMACPYFAGLVLLLLAKHKKQEEETGQNDCRTVEQIREHLMKYTVDKGIVGRDARWGYGVVEPDKLILNGSSADDAPGDEPVVPVDPPPEPLPRRTFWQCIRDWIRNLFG